MTRKCDLGAPERQLHAILREGADAVEVHFTTETEETL